MLDARKKRLLFGQRKRARRLVVVVSAGFLVASSVYFYFLTNPDVAGTEWLGASFRWEYYLVFVTLIVTALSVYENGLLLSWGVAFSFFFGMLVNGGGVGMGSSTPDPLFFLAAGIIGGLVGSVTVGTLGFALGRVVRSNRAGS